jgi:hypothetical protein
MSLQQKRGLGRVFYFIRIHFSVMFDRALTDITLLNPNNKNLAVPPNTAYAFRGRAIHSYAFFAALRRHNRFYPSQGKCTL